MIVAGGRLSEAYAVCVFCEIHTQTCDAVGGWKLDVGSVTVVLLSLIRQALSCIDLRSSGMSQERNIIDLRIPLQIGFERAMNPIH